MKLLAPVPVISFKHGPKKRFLLLKRQSEVAWTRVFLLDSYGNAVLMSLIRMLKGVVILEEMLEVALFIRTHGILASTAFAAAISTPITSDTIYCGKKYSPPFLQSFVADISDQKIRRSNLSLSLPLEGCQLWPPDRRRNHCGNLTGSPKNGKVRRSRGVGGETVLMCTWRIWSRGWMKKNNMGWIGCLARIVFLHYGLGRNPRNMSQNMIV